MTKRKIEYKPHCAACGALIDEEVTYGDLIIEGRAISDYSYSKDIEINPCRCKNCGEIFDGIIIKLPKKVEE